MSKYYKNNYKEGFSITHSINGELETHIFDAQGVLKTISYEKEVIKPTENDE